MDLMLTVFQQLVFKENLNTLSCITMVLQYMAIYILISPVSYGQILANIHP